MTLYGLMQWLRGEYIPGCQMHYARMNPDPWMAVFDRRMKEVHASRDWEEQGRIISHCARELGRLLATYLNQGPTAQDARPWDAFFNPRIGAENGVISDRRCISCFATKSLTIKAHPKHRIPYLICRECERGRNNG